MQTTSSVVSSRSWLLEPLGRKSESFVHLFLWGLFGFVFVAIGLVGWASLYSGPVARNGGVERLLVPAEMRKISNLFVPESEGIGKYDSDPVKGGYTVRLPKGRFSDKEILEKGREQGFEILGFHSWGEGATMVAENDKWKVTFVTTPDERTMSVWRKLNH